MAERDTIDRLLDVTPNWKVYHTPIGVVAMVRSKRAEEWSRAFEAVFRSYFKPDLDENDDE